MNARRQDPSTPAPPGQFRRHLSPVTALLTAVLALGLAHTHQGSAQTLPTLPAPPVAHPRVDNAIQIRMDGGGLHVEVRESRPADVLRALGARTGVAVTLEGELPGRITRAFTVASVEDAMREVVRGYLTALVFDRAEESDRAPRRAIRVIALGNAPLEGPSASPSPSVIATQPEAGHARADTDEPAPGVDPDQVLTEDDGRHSRGRTLGESASAVRRQAIGHPDPNARQAAQAPGQREAGRAHAPDPAGAARQQAFRTELFETLSRAMRPPATPTGRPRTDNRTR